MELSWSWLGEYVELPDDVEGVAERLTAAGHAVEGIERRGDDVLLDVDVTTNRPDCMNHVGMAREIAALLDRPLLWRPPALDEAEERTADAIEVRLETDDCADYVARVVRGVTIGPSPEWLRRRLESIGLRSINNVVDITNFVLWETGQPIHAFDLERLAGPRIEVRYARRGESLVTLDGERRELGPEVLAIADAERVVALAGIMGGADSEVVEATTDILIESAHFAPTAVRRGAKLLGMHTDASHRFERGADPAACRPAADRVAQLLAELGGGSVLRGAVDSSRPEHFGGFEGTLDLARLDAFAGVSIPAAEAEAWLRRLGFDPRPEGEGRLRLTVPSWRYYDFWQRREDGEVYEADLFEEVMRMFGFDAVPAALPAIGPPDAGSSAEHRLRERIRDLLAAAGFAEAITFAFHHRSSDGTFEGLGRSGEALTIANPLSEQYEVMRRSLLPNLLESARFNQRRGAETVRLFEIGRLFPGGEAEEIEAVAVVGGGESTVRWQRPRPFDLFALKGAVEALAAVFDAEVEARPATVRGLIPGSGCELRIAGEPVGYLGEVDDPDLPYPLFAAELATRPLELASHPEPVRVPSRFPAVAADLTLTHAEGIAWSQIESAVREDRPPDLQSFGLKDRYRGEGVPEEAVNTTIWFLYNAEDRSLTQDEVNERQAALAGRLEGRFGWQRAPEESDG